MSTPAKPVSPTPPADLQNTPAYGVEKIPVTVYKTATEASAAVAREIADLIRVRASAGTTVVLGLATGSTPTALYDELIRLHKDEGLSFQNVITFNLDEYWPMHPDELQSYHRFMREHLFDFIDIDPKNVHIPDGQVPRDQVQQYCVNYEKSIKEAGGIDLQILGIGRTGHVGFNEPGSPRDSKTRLITLDKVTRMDAASDFFGNLASLSQTGSEELKALIAKSKYKSAAGFGVKTKSPILLQDHGDEVSLRNLKLRVPPAK